MGGRVWTIGMPDSRRSDEINRALGIGRLAGDVLASRGYDPESAASFLCGAQSLDDPFALADMDKAVRRILAAVEAGERITVFGDYDCDGIAATVIVNSYLEAIGADVGYYIPHREEEGYGLSRMAIDQLNEAGTKLIVTVDNGISAIDEVLYASQIGVDVVITDHHHPREQLPAAAAVVDPRRADCPSSFKALAGVGVAFKLICALEGDSGESLLEEYGDLVALATVADVVELTGENRYLVRHGLQMLRSGARPGLAALMEQVGIGCDGLTAEQIAFCIAPRINAVGRMDSADTAVRLLLSEDVEEAARLAGQMEEYNRERRRMEQLLTEDIDRRLSADPQLAAQRLLILWGENWHGGIIGIACSKLVERMGKPVVLITCSDDGTAKGSGRSVDGFSLIDAVGACSSHLSRYGGHTLAAGFSLDRNKVEAFAEAMQRYAAQNCPLMPVPALKVDCAVDAPIITLESALGLAALEPFGVGNETPLLALLGAKLERILPTVDQKHLRIRLTRDGCCLHTVYFCVRRDELPCCEGDDVDIAFQLSAGEYMGETRLSVKIRDMRPAGFDQQNHIRQRLLYEAFLRREEGWEYPVPTREDIAAVYRFIRARRAVDPEDEFLYTRLPDPGIGYFKAKASVDILRELDLLAPVSDENHHLTINEQAQKVDIHTSSILKGLISAHAR